MKLGILLFFLVASLSVVFGQSPKKLNKQLRAELLVLRQGQDSAYQLFVDKKREFDSLRKLTTKMIGQLADEEKKVHKLGARFSEMVTQLKELGENPYSIITLIDKPDGIPSHREETRSIREIFKTEVEFDRVVEGPSLEELKIKPQNNAFKNRIEEYHVHSRSNSIQQYELEKNIGQLDEFVPVFDSLSRVYQLIESELRWRNGKLMDKLDELGADYVKRGPHGFPEAYSNVFSDAFPPPQSETKEEVNLNGLTREGMVAEEIIGAAPIKPEPEVYENVDEPALFPGGPDKCRIFVRDNLRDPEKTKETAANDKTVLRFVVSEKGEISDIKVLKGSTDCKECDEEAIRLVKLMPNWIPATVNGKNVKSYGRFAIYFNSEEK